MFRLFCERPAASATAILHYGALALLVFLALEGCSSTTGPGAPDTGGTIVAWGNNGYGQCDVPAANEDFVGVAGGSAHSLGLTAP